MFFSETINWGYISPSAVIHENATLDRRKVYIGHFSVIGKCKIGENVVIKNNVVIEDNVIIGNNVVIESGTVIGKDGFGYSKNPLTNEYIKFPHKGKVIIEDDVEIGANTCIDRGALSDTIIKKGSKIDNLVHIAHNVEIGENSIIIAGSVIGGSTKVGKNSWLAPSVTLRNGIDIGENVVVGLGSVVTKDLESDKTYSWFPAIEFSNFIELWKKIKKL